jgi:hypothetical protein
MRVSGRAVLSCLVLVLTMICSASQVSAYKFTSAVGGTGGIPFQFVCPNNHYLVGFWIETGSWLDSFRAFCGPATTDGRWALEHGYADQNWAEPWGNDFAVGGGGGIAITPISCPKDTFVGAIYPRVALIAPRYLYDLTIECVGLLTGRKNGVVVRIPHTANHPNFYATGALRCQDPGSLAIGVYGQAGAFIDRLGAVCDTANFWLMAPPPPPLPPPSPPQACKPSNLCNDGVDFQCAMINQVVVLQRLDSGIWHDVSTDTDPNRAHIPFISDFPGDGRDTGVYRACSRNAGGDTCPATGIKVTFAHVTCSTGGGGGGGIPRQCGGPGQPKCGPIRFQ